MPATGPGPFTERDYQKLNRVLDELGNTYMEVKRAAQAGFDCLPESKACEELKTRLEKFKAAYFPERP